jgi:hypothetical protein
MFRWPWNRQRRPIALSKRAVDFLGEQDGRVERELKQELRRVLEAESQISAAYLARIVYEDSKAPEVALCVRATLTDRKGLVERVGSVFAGIFSRDQHLDIVFLDADEEELLQSVCSAFYRRAA